MAEAEKQTITSADVATVDAVLAATDKHPTLRKLYKELMTKKAPLAKALDEARAKLDALTQTPEVNALRAEIKRLNVELGPIDNELAGLARALGTKGMRLEPGAYTG